MDTRRAKSYGTEKLLDAFRTFPLSDASDVAEDGSDVNLPSDEEVKDARDWVNFKEM